ncbi:aspartate 4-decarboxylase [Clostridium sp. CCUG 7971]|uniref:aspartate 4-decarboxylase n=1 Tax=Clostridium sp. CCUG 7971 TaxID=2811414 RepID=UPI001ABA3439|nr:aspartate 4-decarboxylase [Clostridium sp. CCUG 7971]MBO3445140.1 aspartate 4-decarboxylase [Clostridium sp. CCUG 7971]
MDDRELKREQLIEKVKTLSPFELKDELINLAKKSERKGVRVLLNAGRGNPNWTASTPRQSFFTLGQFAVHESQRVWCDGDLAGMPEKQGIYDRFKAYYNERKDVEGIELLDKIIDYGIEKHNFEPDSWVFELVDGIIGDNYPVPDRMLIRIEKVVREYLIKEMGGNLKDATQDLFAVEGGTAAMCYIFDSLIANYLMNKGDKLALMVPIFTPYIDIPDLPRYKFDVVEVRASSMSEEGRHTWQYPKEELDKLADPSIKALCIVNPSNPPSVAMDEESMNYLKKIVEEKNPNLIIITDDVYGTFADNFKSLMVTMPFNTLGVYSFSKYFGVTGWRLGVIALAKDNIFNKLISELPNDKKDIIAERYSSLTTEPEKIKFIDRIVADSRQVALNHTAGLSTPLQVQMAIFSIFALLDSDNRYKEKTKSICRKRKQLLYDNLIGLPIKVDPHSTSYYNQYDLLIWAKMKYGKDFARYLEKERDVIEFLFELAERHSIVLLNGGGFEGPTWSIRVSLANLKDEQYIEIGKAINNLFDEYARDWKESR